MPVRDFRSERILRNRSAAQGSARPTTTDTGSPGGRCSYREERLSPGLDVFRTFPLGSAARQPAISRTSHRGSIQANAWSPQARRS